MNRYLPVSVAVIFITVASIFQGIWTDRWGLWKNPQLMEFTQRLDDIPLTIGEWEGVDSEVSSEQIAGARVTGHVARSYRNTRTNSVVNMFVVCGTARNLFEHTPMQCYPAAGFKEDSQPNPFTITAETPSEDVANSRFEFATTSFKKEEVIHNAGHLRVFWSFTADGNWLGPNAPKYQFGASPALYKVYLITPVNSEENLPPEKSPSVEFGAVLMPKLNEVLFPKQPSEAVKTPATADE